MPEPRHAGSDGPPGSGLARRVVRVSAEDVLPPGTSDTADFVVDEAADLGEDWWRGAIVAAGRRSGKTALLYAMARNYLRRHPGATVAVYGPARR